jgi:hypothetical protein
MPLRLGIDTGSYINHLASREIIGQPTPEVGMGATLLLWTDRHAATIVAIHDARPGRWIIEVQTDYAKVVEGSTFDGSARYEYFRDPEGTTKCFRFDSRRGWRRVVWNAGTGRWNFRGGDGLKIGVRDEHRDPHF